MGTRAHSHMVDVLGSFIEHPRRRSSAHLNFSCSLANAFDCRCYAGVRNPCCIANDVELLIELDGGDKVHQRSGVNDRSLAELPLECLDKNMRQEIELNCDRPLVNTEITQ